VLLQLMRCVTELRLIQVMETYGESSGPFAAMFNSHASLTTCGASQRLAADRGVSGVELWRRKDQEGRRGKEWVNTCSQQVAGPQ
ncbi:hypothetical protein GOODEAATRI_032576, partial [Goodea atripinnis]